MSSPDVSRSDSESNLFSGILCGAAAFISWGVLPLYWNLVRSVPATEVLAHRIVWSLGFVLLIVFLNGQQKKLFVALRNRRILLTTSVSALIIGINWWTFIWAVTHGYVLQSSLGYFINPLMSIILGVFLLGEKLTNKRKIAIGLATIGCLSMAVVVGEFPVLGLFLALSFAAYGYLRKISPLGSILGLALETLLLFPAALLYLVYQNYQGTLSFGHSDLQTNIVLIGSGAVTAVPLLLFAEAARRIPLSVLGLLQYLSPSGQFLLAVFLYHETFGVAHFTSFAFIWVALLIFSYDMLRSTLSGRARALPE